MERSQLVDLLTNSLLTYLPEAAVSLSSIIETLQTITVSDTEPDLSDLLSKIKHIMQNATTPLLANATEFVEMVEVSGSITDEENELYNRYSNAMHALMDGVNGLIDWIRDVKDEKGSNDKLSESIDSLFESSQLILNLVEELTKIDKKNKD